MTDEEFNEYNKYQTNPIRRIAIEDRRRWERLEEEEWKAEFKRADRIKSVKMLIVLLGPMRAREVGKAIIQTYDPDFFEKWENLELDNDPN